MIEKIFYEEIIPECSSNTLTIGELKPTIFFDVKIKEDNIDTCCLDVINPKPVLVINDKTAFFKELEKYVSKGISFYYNGDNSHDNVKSLIAYVLANASTQDLDNPVSYLQLRTSFLDTNNEITDYNLKNDVLGYDGEIKINKLKPFLEAPYSFSFELKDEENKYFFPNIIFGINNDTAYVYAIQNKFLENNPLRKKINRMLFKIGAGFKDDEDSDVFNARDVSMPFVAVLIIFTNYLIKVGIEKISVKVNLPIRYNSHYESYKRRINYAVNQYCDDEFIKYKDKLEKENKAYDDNSIMKLIRTFYRVVMQGDVLKIDRYPFIHGSEFVLFINKEGSFYNDFCNELFNKTKWHK